MADQSADLSAERASAGDAAAAIAADALMAPAARLGRAAGAGLALGGVSRPTNIAALAIILTALLGVWAYGSTRHFIPCEQNCGEAFDALQYVDNYRLYGFRYGLVQDMATAMSLEARPFFYTHNVNLAGIIFTLLDAIGLRPLWAKQLVTLAATGAGLWYAYRAVSYHARSWLAGLTVLVLLATDVEHVLTFALNPLRAWHWLPIFGLLFHVGRLAREPRRAPRTDAIAIVLLASVAFGIGYDYWIICGGLAVAMLALGRGRRIVSFGTLAGMVGLGLGFAIPFVLRQIQIASVLGPSFWFTDVVLSAAIKVSVLSRFVAVPSTEELDAIYQAAGVLGRPASPSSTLSSIMSTLSDMVMYAVLPSFGLLSLVVAACVVVVSVVVALAALLMRRRRLVQVLARLQLVGMSRAGLIGSARMVVALTFAVGAGLAFFAPLSLHIYLKHEFPLFAAPMLIVKALVLAGVVGLCRRSGAVNRRAFLVSAGFAAFLLIDHAVVQVEDIRARQPMDVSWIPAVTARADKTFAVSWIPSAASVFTDTWAVGIAPGKERDLAERGAAGRPLFTVDDYFLFGERDGKQNAATYERPDLWLYFPTEQLTPFDQPRPPCRQDYLTRVASRLTGGARPPSVDIPLFVTPTSVRPGGLLGFGAVVAGGRQSGIVAELMQGDVVLADLNYNCMYGRVLGEYRVPTDLQAGVQTYGVRLRQPDQRVFSMAPVEVKIDPTVGDGPPRMPGAGRPQPSVDEMIALFPQLPVVERGAGWVIFDLRALRG